MSLNKNHGACQGFSLLYFQFLPTFVTEKAEMIIIDWWCGKKEDKGLNNTDGVHESASNHVARLFGPH